MFANRIRRSSFVNDNVDHYFPITGNGIHDDTSFIATLRALLMTRIGKDSLSFYADTYPYVRNNVEGRLPKVIADWVGETIFCHRLTLYAIEPIEAGVGEMFLSKLDDPESGFKERFNLTEITDAKAFALQHASLNLRCYINPDRRASLIVAVNLDIRKYHFIQSMIPRLLPWYFEDKPLTEDELSLVKSLTHRRSTDYESLLEKLACQLDVRSIAIKRVIGDFERQSRQDEIDASVRAVSSIQDRIEDLNARYRTLIEDLDAENIRLSGLRSALAAASEDSELIDYFICNKALNIEYASGHCIAFSVKTYLDSFDPEMYSVYSSNPNSHLFHGYDFCSVFKSVESRKKVLDAIFSDDPLLKVRMCSNYTIDLRGAVSSEKHHDYGSDFIGYIPNPHIDYFSCLGNYQRYIVDCLKSGNTIAAIEQCVASAKSINLCESITVRNFLTDFFSSNSKLIELPDGTCVSPIEALEYLNSRETAADEEEQNG